MSVTHSRAPFRPTTLRAPELAPERTEGMTTVLLGFVPLRSVCARAACCAILPPAPEKAQPTPWLLNVFVLPTSVSYDFLNMNMFSPIGTARVAATTANMINVFIVYS